MFRHIIVPLDGSPLSGASLPLVRALASIDGSTVTLVRVVPTDWRTDPVATEAEDYLRGVADELSRSGLRVRTAVRLGGKPSEQILALRQELDADLIVLATHGRSGLARVIYGSVTDGILQKAPVPVVVMKPGGRRVTRIKTLLVPVDGSPGSSIALGTAVALAKATAARLVLVEVSVPVPLWVYGAELQGGYVDPVWDEDAQASALHHVNSLVQRLQAAGIQAEGVAPTGDPAALIEQEAQRVEADLIVMSTHALVGPRRTLLGSVADEVVRTAGRPVVLVRRGSPAKRARGRASARVTTTSAVLAAATRDGQVRKTGFDPSA